MNEFIYGRNATLEAIKNNRGIINVIIAKNSMNNNKDIIEKAKANNITITYKEKEYLDKITKNHQGVISEVFKYEYKELDDLITDKEYPVIVMLDGLEDPHNLGAIIRTCEICQVDGVIIPKNRSVSVNATVAKVSCGGIENVKIAQVTNLTQTLKYLKEKGYWVVGAEAMDESKNLWDMDFKMKTVLIIGSEGKGISRLVREECDYLVKIPMWGKINSLNASVSAAVILYEIRRQVS